MKTTRTWLGANWWWLLLLLLSLGVMWPRIASAQFGIADDGQSLSNAQKILVGSWSPADEAATGRFRPVYWLWFAAIYALVGPSPAMFFLSNWLVLALTAIGIAFLVSRGEGSHLQAFLAGTFFILSGPVIESFYTLSKSEPTQVLLLVLALLLAQQSARRRAGVRRVAFGLLTMLAVSLAIFAKETSLTLVAISGAWLGLDLLVRRSRYDRTSLIMLIACLLGAVVFLGARAFFVGGGIQQGAYAGRYAVSIPMLLSAAYRWGGWLIRDYAYLLVAFILIPIIRRIASFQSTKPYMIGAVLWITGWILIFLPWVFTVEYYMLPLAAGAGVLAGIVFGAALASPQVSRNAAWDSLVVIGLLLFLPTLGNNISNARLQLVVDRENAAMLDYVAGTAPRDERLYINLPPENAYIEHIAQHLVLRGRADILVASYDLLDPPAGSYEVAALTLKNQPLFFVRLGTYEQGADIRNTALRNIVGQDREPVFESESSFRQSDTNFVSVACILLDLNFCRSHVPLFDARPLQYGWQIYSTEEH
jgi:hypothetical protein